MATKKAKGKAKKSLAEMRKELARRRIEAAQRKRHLPPAGYISTNAAAKLLGIKSRAGTLRVLASLGLKPTTTEAGSRAAQFWRESEIRAALEKALEEA